MRILPAAYYLYSRFGADLTKSRKAMDIVHKASALTHRHAIALSACGIYANIAVRPMEGVDRETAVRDGAGAALGWYRRHEKFAEALPIWERIRDTDSLAELPETEICLLYTSGSHPALAQKRRISPEIQASGNQKRGNLAGERDREAAVSEAARRCVCASRGTGRNRKYQLYESPQPSEGRR